MIRAFAYLIVHSTRNKWLSQIKRIRNPRYAIALLLGIGYFVLLSFNMTRNGGAPPNPVSTIGSSALAVLLPMLLLVMAAYAWLFGTDGTALAFTQAEVSMLFTAPVSRRALIVYKLVRSQAAVLVTTLIWFVVFRRSGGIERALSYWVGLSILNTHRLGISLIRASGAAHGIAASRRNLPAVALFVGAFGVVATAFGRALGSILNADGMSEKVRVLTAVATRAPVSWVLYPFHLAVAPGFAAHGVPWLMAMLAALGVLAAHVFWVLWTDANFEEAAAEASAKRAVQLATLRTRGVSGARIAKAKRRALPLSASGAPWVAIVWKNFLYLQRADMLRSIIGLPLVLAAVAVVCAGRWEVVVAIAMSTSFAVAGTITFFGPMSLRSDLRAELARLPILKTMPLRGREIVLAEIVGTATPAAIMQILLVLSGTLALSLMPRGVLPVAYMVGGFIGGPILLFGLNLANFTIHNGMALLFPAWVRTGEAGTAGVETIGQGVLTVVITSFLLLVLALIPIAVGGGLYLYWRPLPTVAIAFSTIAAGVILGVESFGLMHLLGRSLERLEPAQVG
jgi:ABC-2 type transport system permease protein